MSAVSLAINYYFNCFEDINIKKEKLNNNSCARQSYEYDNIVDPMDISADKMSGGYGINSWAAGSLSSSGWHGPMPCMWKKLVGMYPGIPNGDFTITRIVK